MSRMNIRQPFSASTRVLARSAGCLCLLCAVSRSALARIYHIDGRSEDRSYEVVLNEQTRVGGTTYSYDLVRRQDHRILASVAASYQPDQFELPGFSLQHAKLANVIWNNANDLVAIDEVNHRHIGDVFVFCISARGSARTVDLHHDEILVRTGRRWDKHRFFNPHWEKAHILSLELAGRADSADNEIETTSYKAKLRIVPKCKSRLLSVTAPSVRSSSE